MLSKIAEKVSEILETYPEIQLAYVCGTAATLNIMHDINVDVAIMASMLFL
jgi:hypothetical protein